MGSLTLAYPSIAGKTTQEQLESMRRYLCSVTEQLNLADWSAKATLTEISQAIDADSLSEAEKKNDALRLWSAESAHHQDGGLRCGKFGDVVDEAVRQLCGHLGLRQVSREDTADDRGKLRRHQTAV